MDLCESVALSEERVLPVVASSLLVGQKRVTFMTRGRNISYWRNAFFRRYPLFREQSCVST